MALEGALRLIRDRIEDKGTTESQLTGPAEASADANGRYRCEATDTKLTQNMSEGYHDGDRGWRLEGHLSLWSTVRFYGVLSLGLPQRQKVFLYEAVFLCLEICPSLS